MYFLEKISLSNPSGIEFGYATFAYCCNLKHCNIPKNFIPVNPFMYCNTIKRISIPYAIRGYFCFRDCFQLDKSYVYINLYSGLNQSIARIYDNNCLIEKFIINEGPTTTETYIAYQCKNLKQVELPSTINNITYYTFETNINLESIYIKATTPPTLSSAFIAPNTFYKIYVPRASCAAYKAATNWSTIADHIYPYDYTAIPDALYFYMPNGGDVTLTKTGTPTEVELEYSLDCGDTWTTWTESNNVRTLTLTVGQTMFVRNTNETSTGFSTGMTSYYRFSFSSIAYADGKVNSLVCKNPDVATINNWIFYALFGSQTNLYSSPILTFTVINANRAYRQMFNNCSNIAKIKTYMTNVSGTESLYNWLNGVAATGVFYCPSTLTIPTDSASGIPTGWTRHNID